MPVIAANPASSHSGSYIMSSVYAFLSSDPDIRGLSIDPSGRNIPADEQLSFDLSNAVIPFNTTHIARYVPDTVLAMRDLKLRGYHLFREVSRNRIELFDQNRGR